MASMEVVVTEYTSIQFALQAHDIDFLLPKTLLKALLTGITVHLANQGAPHTLRTSLNGSNAFVTAYAVANSTTNLVPPSPLFHHFRPLVFSISPMDTPARASRSTSTSSSAAIHPFLLKYRPNFSTPATTHAPSAKYGGSQL